MILYEVNAEIKKDLANAYLEWLGPHIEKILKEPGFISAQVFQEKDECSAAAHFTVHYSVESSKDLENYFKGPAPKFRQEAVQKFGENLSIRRRELVNIFSQLKPT